MRLEDLKLPEPVERTLTGFIEAARTVLGEELRAIVLYGSAAEGRLRKTSDVNVIVVLSAFDASIVDGLREPLRTAHAAVALEAMFLLESEIASAVEAFAVKFADVLQRRLVLFGDDPFVGMAPSRGAEITRLRQVVLNLVLRLRQRYLLRSLRAEQAAALVADTAGPIRTCAEALLELEGKPAPSPKEALERVAKELPDAGWDEVLKNMSQARETGELPSEVAANTVLRLLELATAIQRRAEALRQDER